MDRNQSTTFDKSTYAEFFETIAANVSWLAEVGDLVSLNFSKSLTTKVQKNV